MLFFRHISVEDIINISGRQNEIIARSIGNHFATHFDPISELIAEHGGAHTPNAKKIEEISKSLRAQIQSLPVLKASLITLDGREIVSSTQSAIATVRQTGEAFASAREGLPASESVAAANQGTPDQTGSDREILSSFIPIRDSTGTVVGVFSIQSDLTLPLKDIDKHVHHVFVALLVALGVLYLVLYQVIRRADKTIKNQHTELQRSTEELKKALVSTEEANHAKSSFLATMTHEFRTPLNAILGFSEIIKLQAYGPSSREKYEEYAGIIHESGVHMLGLVNDVLDISAIESGNSSLAKGTVDIDTLLKRCLKNFEQNALEAGIEITLETSGSLPTLHANQRSIYQIFLNLISNAIKFTKPNGRITVHAAKRDRYVDIQVVDTGIGIPQDKLMHVMEPFFQIHADPFKSDRGTGLGLSIVASLVESHNGTLNIESEPGKGTTVSLSFPCNDED